MASLEKMAKAMRDERQAHPMGEVLGTISEDLLTPGPQGTSTTYSTESGEGVTVTEPPPPWEMEDHDVGLSDARRFVDVPANWSLRWINPRFLEADGWRYWKAISPNDEHVRVKVDQMAMPDGTIRRGGPGGDILAWMYTSWYDAARKKQAQKTTAQTNQAIENFESVKDDFRRGKYGPHIGLESGSKASHPRYTMADGRSMQKDP